MRPARDPGTFVVSVGHRIFGTRCGKRMLRGALVLARRARNRWAPNVALRRRSLESGWAGLQAFRTCKPHSHLLWNP